MTRDQIIARNDARRGLLVPAPEAPIYMWNGWRVHEDSVWGVIKGDHIFLMPPVAFQQRVAA